jgi:hypothetical protein
MMFTLVKLMHTLDNLEESGKNTQASEDGDAASDGIESSINSDPCPSRYYSN